MKQKKNGTGALYFSARREIKTGSGRLFLTPDPIPHPIKILLTGLHAYNHYQYLCCACIATCPFTFLFKDSKHFSWRQFQGTARISNARLVILVILVDYIVLCIHNKENRVHHFTNDNFIHPTQYCAIETV